MKWLTASVLCLLLGCAVGVADGGPPFPDAGAQDGGSLPGGDAGSTPDSGTVPDAGPGQATAGIYGPGVGLDSKSNRRIGAGNAASAQSISHRFRASTTSRLLEVVWARRTSYAGYSLGTGGIAKLSLQTDDGTAQHFPSGTILDSFTYAIPNGSAAIDVHVRQPFPNPGQGLT